MSAQTIHRVPTTHLNSAGTGRMPAAVRAVLADRTAQDDRGPYAPEESLAPVLDAEIHERLGALLGVPARRTALFTGAADAFDSYVSRLPLGPGDRIWTTPHEGVARLVTLHALRARTRCTLEVVPLREDGDLDLDWMREHLDEHVALVSVVHVSSACGTVNPVEAIGRLLAAHRALYAVDASHSVGRLPRRRHAHRLRAAHRRRLAVPARPGRHRVRLRGPGPGRVDGEAMRPRRPLPR